MFYEPCNLECSSSSFILDIVLLYVYTCSRLLVQAAIDGFACTVGDMGRRGDKHTPAGQCSKCPSVHMAQEGARGVPPRVFEAAGEAEVVLVRSFSVAASTRTKPTTTINEHGTNLNDYCTVLHTIKR